MALRKGSWLAGAALVAVSGAALAQDAAAPAAPAVPYIPDYAAAVEGKPIDTRPPEIAGGQPVFPGQTHAPYHKTAPYKVTEITGGLHSPWALAILPDGKFLVTEKLPGALRVVDASGAIAPPVTGLPANGLNWPETGLFDVELDPHYAANHRIFFSFWAFDHGMMGGIQLARATFDEAANGLSDVKVIFRALPSAPNDRSTSTGTRSGGRIAFGPDGFLYLTVGDKDAGTSFPWRVAQTLDTHLGKVLRLTLDGKPAPGNPYTGQEGALPENWAIGQRSQEGLAFDLSGKLWEVEDGPRGGDELNLIEPGKNYGWPIISHGVDYPGPPMGDAKVAAPGMEQPAYYWSPSTAPSGLMFYKGNLFPQWKGNVFVGMLRGKSLERLTMANGKVVNEEPLLTEVGLRIRDVREGPDGAIYVLTDGLNAVVRDDSPADNKLLKLTPR